MSRLLLANYVSLFFASCILPPKMVAQICQHSSCNIHHTQRAIPLHTARNCPMLFPVFPWNIPWNPHHTTWCSMKFHIFSSGWWFGTMEFYEFPFSWEWNNHPNWLSLPPWFFRGVGRKTTNQIYWIIFIYKFTTFFDWIFPLFPWHIPIDTH